MRVRVGWNSGGGVNSYALLLHIRWRVIILASIDVTSGNRRPQVVYLERTIDVCFSIVLVVLSIVLC